MLLRKNLAMFASAVLVMLPPVWGCFDTDTLTLQLGLFAQNILRSIAQKSLRGADAAVGHKRPRRASGDYTKAGTTLRISPQVKGFTAGHLLQLNDTPMCQKLRSKSREG